MVGVALLDLKKTSEVDATLVELKTRIGSFERVKLAFLTKGQVPEERMPLWSSELCFIKAGDNQVDLYSKHSSSFHASFLPIINLFCSRLTQDAASLQKCVKLFRPEKHCVWSSTRQVRIPLFNCHVFLYLPEEHWYPMWSKGPPREYLEMCDTFLRDSQKPEMTFDEMEAFMLSLGVSFLMD